MGADTVALEESKKDCAVELVNLLIMDAGITECLYNTNFNFLQIIVLVAKIVFIILTILYATIQVAQKDLNITLEVALSRSILTYRYLV